MTDPSEKPQRPFNTEEDMPYVENRDPLFGYRYVETVMQAECAPVLRGVQSLIDLAPDMHFKATSRLEDDTLYYLSREGMYRRHWSALATAVAHGKDFDRDREYYIERAHNELKNSGYADPEAVIQDLASQPTLTVGETLSAALPYYSSLDKRVKVTLGNLILNERIKKYEETASPTRPGTIEEPDPDPRTQLTIQAPPLPQRGIALVPSQQLMQFINDPQIDPNAHKYLGRILGQFGRQLPLKTTVQYGALTFEGFIRENFQKLAEGFEAGIDLQERSRICGKEVQTALKEQPGLANILTFFSKVTFFSQPLAAPISAELTNKIMNHLLIEAMTQKGNKTDVISQ